ncbi:unnamed protein product [Calypogeia fissa]
MNLRIGLTAMSSLRLIFPLLVTVVLLVASQAAGSPLFMRHSRNLHHLESVVDSSKYLTTDAKLLTQRVDHYNPLDRRTFQQRYYEFTDYFKGPDGPIFLKICGESTCSGISNDYNGVLAEQFGAALITLEHRYYGESLLFDNFETENMIYLSSKQALFDLAAFRNFYQEEVNKRYGRSGGDNPWIVFGVSYSGALSAWFQIKFPHLSNGAIASSGVVLAVYNYTDFDRQVAESAGPICSAALRQVTAEVDAGLKSNPVAIKAKFGAEQLKVDGDFLYFLADAAAEAIQYGNPDKLCSPLEDVYLKNGDVLGTFATFVEEFFVGYFGVPVDTYDQEQLKDSTINPNSGDRMWWYQVCTEVAYFQGAYNNSIRSAGVSIQWHLDLCENIFGKGVYPETDLTNLYYGGTAIYGSKIVFTNGSQDPWRWASKQTSSPGEPSIIITCHNCGHGSDMRGCPQSPLVPKGDPSQCEKPEEVIKARQVISEYISEWVGASTSSF